MQSAAGTETVRKQHARFIWARNRPRTRDGAAPRHSANQNSTCSYRTISLGTKSRMKVAVAKRSVIPAM